jgi:multiple sugar transport system permease protein
MLRPTTFFVVTIGIIGTLQVFDQVYVISSGSGNPAGTTLTVALNVYRSAFTSAQAGLGGATAFLLFVMIMVFTLLQRRITGRAEQ